MNRFKIVATIFFLWTMGYGSNQPQITAGNTWLYSWYNSQSEYNINYDVTIKITQFTILSKADVNDTIRFSVLVRDSGVQLNQSATLQYDTMKIFTIDTITCRMINNVIYQEPNTSQWPTRYIEFQDNPGTSSLFDNLIDTMGYYTLYGSKRAVTNVSTSEYRYYIQGIGLLAYDFFLYGTGHRGTITEDLLAFNGIPITGRKIIDSLRSAPVIHVKNQNTLHSSHALSVRQAGNTVIVSGTKDEDKASIFVIDSRGRRFTACSLSSSGNYFEYSFRLQNPIAGVYFVYLRQKNGLVTIKVPFIR